MSKLMVQRVYTKDIKGSPYDEFERKMFNPEIKDSEGNVVFSQSDVIAPAGWSQAAVNIVASKYFRGHIGTPERESSVFDLVKRVVDKIAYTGLDAGYFDYENMLAFSDELAYAILSQEMSFGSPVWFNIGVPGRRQQSSACFINSVEDTMESILDLVKTEGMLFKFGSGAGSNLSALREEGASLTGGGTSSGPVSFMKGFDSFAGVIKSGGGTRRAAKMVILNDSHPDIEEFIDCKSNEEKKARALINAGYTAEFNAKGGAYDSVAFQNANHSVRLSDDFMRAVAMRRPWELKSVKDGRTVKTVDAMEILDKIASAAWECGDPGVQFDGPIQLYNTVKKSGRINATNPCSEFVFIDDTACNLASINLLKFKEENGKGFDFIRFGHLCHLTILAQEILVTLSEYPTHKIAENSRKFRPLGLGYANLGALLMSSGIPYGSSDGRNYAAAITAVMHAAALKASAEMASVMGAFEEFENNKDSMMEVVSRHIESLDNLVCSLDTTGPDYITDIASWAIAQMTDAYRTAEKHGFRNAQVTLLAPTGTISFMMDCSTTGVEPELSLVKHKKLVGGGTMKLVNKEIEPALRNLGYSDDTIFKVANYVLKNNTMEGSGLVKEEHMDVFMCSIPSTPGGPAIHYMDHVRMMVAIQPFLSGAISKTINMPTSSTVQDIKNVYVESWIAGLKCIAVYRDGCKLSQPISAAETKKLDDSNNSTNAVETVNNGSRRKMPAERNSITHKFNISGHDGYITAGMYEDGSLGEIFICMSKEGSTISGLMDSLALVTSIALQHGVPLKTLVDKLSHYRFEPHGFTTNPNLPMAKSIVDYIFRWLDMRFGQQSDSKPSAENVSPKHVQSEIKEIVTGPPCSYCGSITVRSGSCYKCDNCGSTTGCS